MAQLLQPAPRALSIGSIEEAILGSSKEPIMDENSKSAPVDLDVPVVQSLEAATQEFKRLARDIGNRTEAELVAMRDRIDALIEVNKGNTATLEKAAEAYGERTEQVMTVKASMALSIEVLEEQFKR